jgi:hypothetical protein
MRIPLSSHFREPISAIIEKETSKWLGFLPVDMLNPQTDGLALLRGATIFAMQLRTEYVNGKVEKGFDLIPPLHPESQDLEPRALSL